MDPVRIREKFGDDYTADEQTLVMGIDKRFTAAIAERFRGRSLLETHGRGIYDHPLARVARHVTTIEIDPGHQIRRGRTWHRPFCVTE